MQCCQGSKGRWKRSEVYSTEAVPGYPRSAFEVICSPVRTEVPHSFNICGAGRAWYRGVQDRICGTPLHKFSPITNRRATQ